MRKPSPTFQLSSIWFSENDWLKGIRVENSNKYMLRRIYVTPGAKAKDRLPVLFDFTQGSENISAKGQNVNTGQEKAYSSKLKG